MWKDSIMQKSIAKNIVYKILLNVFNVILPILVGPYAYRTLGASSMGKVNFSETIFTYFLSLLYSAFINMD